MTTVRLAAVFLILFVATGASFGGQGKDVEESRNIPLDELRAKGYEALYNLDYEDARKYFREMVRRFPEHPAGSQSMAASIWLEELNRSRRLRASLYNTDSIQKEAAEPVDRRTIEQFREWTKKAKQLADARLRLNPRDVEALYFLGATDALKAVFSASIERRFLAASRDAASAWDRHREVLKLDPNLHDAELSIGMYSYVVGSLPLPLKILVSVGGVRGSKKRGLETLERVAREGRWARDMARVLLIDLYKREKRWTDAIAVSRDLSARYPGNYLFQLQTADSLILRANAARRSKDPTGLASADTDELEAFKIFETLIQGRGSQAVPQDVVHFRFGENLLLAQQPERAAKEFLAAARVSGSDSGLATMARLRAAQSMDLAKNKKRSPRKE